MRMIAEFEKTGPACFIGHLDLQRVIGRALRRARLPLRYSQGFNPHPVLSFASALPVGCESGCELMDLGLSDQIEADAFAARLNDALPRGLRITRARLVEEDAPSPMAVIGQADYAAVFPGDVSAAVEAFRISEEVMALKKSKKKEQHVNIRPLVLAIGAETDGEKTKVWVRVRHDNAVSLKPALLFEAMGLPDLPARRTALRMADGQEIYQAL